MRGFSSLEGVGTAGAGDGAQAASGASAAASAVLSEQVLVLGIAYHNMGVECEFARKYEPALQWYLRAVTLTQQHKHLAQHPLATAFKQAFDDAKRVRIDRCSLSLVRRNCSCVFVDRK